MTVLQEPTGHIAECAALDDRELKRLRRAARRRAIAQIRALMADHGLTVIDVDPAPPALPQTKALRMYRHPLSGQTWNGRGKRPLWLVAALAAGRALEDYAI